jgi:hypothetical protein
VIEAAAAVCVTAIIFLLAGLPVAIATRREREGWAALAADSAIFGIVVVTLTITAGTALGWWASIVLAALWIAAVATIRWWGSLAGLGRPRLSRGGLWWAIAVVVVVVALAFRLETVEFLPWVGDMGAYVNWANEFVRTGTLSATWPPLFPVFLAVSGWIFGIAGTTAGVSLTGLLLLAGVSRVLWRLGVNRWIVLAVVGALALNIHGIWYSSFPASESLSAPLFVAWINVLVAMAQTSNPRRQTVLAFVAFLVFTALGLLRASAGLLLAPLAIVAVSTLLFAAWRPMAATAWRFLAASVLGALISFWYGIAVIPAYFVETQVQAEVPRFVFVILRRSGALAPGLVSGALVIVLAAAIIALAVWLPRLVARRARRDSTSLKASAIALCIVAGLFAVEIILLLAVGSNVAIIVLRMGIWLPVGTIVALVGLGLRRRVDPASLVSVLLGAVVIFFCAFQTFRLGNDRPHAFYLYWDRYLVSEVFPAMAILAGLGAAIVLTWSLRSRAVAGLARGVRATVFAALVTIVAIVASALPNIGMLHTMATGTYMRGDYAFTNRLAAEARSHRGANLWGATTAGPIPTFFFPNTWMAFAVPLIRSYGIPFENVSQGDPNFGPDAVVSAADIAKEVSCDSSVYVFETQNGGKALAQRLKGSGYPVQKVATQTSNIQLLSQPPVNGTWTYAHITVTTWRVSDLAANCTS